MLSDKDAMANIAVKNLETARKFYQDTLGLKQVASEGDEVLTFKSGNSKILVYRSQYAGTNKATSMLWAAGDDMEKIVRALKDKGVVFEHYDLPGLTLQGDIHIGGKLKIVWFKDPDGNILSVVNG